MSEPWEGTPEYVDEGLARAMTHPMRVQILAELNQRVMSPKQFSTEYEQKLPTVSYHFRVLHESECLELVGQRPVRGAVEHFYKATKRVLFDGKAWDNLPDSIRERISGRAIGDFLGAVAESMEDERFDARDDRVLYWLQRRLDQRGWTEAVKAHRDLISRMAEIFQGSKIRLRDAGEPGGGMLGTYGLFLFESPPAPEKPREEL
jgi:Helix-turn-helix domain